MRVDEEDSIVIPSRIVSARAYLRNGIRASWIYRGDLAIAMASQIIQVVLLVVVWRTVYGDSAEVQGITVQDAVNYAVLASCIQTAVMPWNFASLTDRVRAGQIGVDMTRPIGLIAQSLSQNIGTTIARMPITMVGLITGVLVGAFMLPAWGLTALVFVLSLAIGAALVLLMNLAMSFVSFWSLEIDGYMLLYRLGSGLASGAVIPLWFMPHWLAMAFQWLPFQAQIFTPLSIYFGQVSGTQVWRLIGIQVFWLLAAMLTLMLLWRRVVHKVVVLGG